MLFSIATVRAVITTIAVVAITAPLASAQGRHIELMCHRTANKDVPENTLESLRFAARMGCDAIEVDVRRTLDGVLMLDHDGYMERLTDGIGELEQIYFADLEMRDAGSWMGPRFAGLRIPTFNEALQVAKQLHVHLYLDIKEPGTTEQIFETVRDEDMLQQVDFGGESGAIKNHIAQIARASALPKEEVVWLTAPASAEQIQAAHRSGKRVMVNFSESGHDMDLAMMHAAVDAGADGINTDYPRLGADAAGRPVEQKIASLVQQVDDGASSSRAKDLLELSGYRGFPLQTHFLRWLRDPDPKVSRAAAVALVTAEQKPKSEDLLTALHSSNSVARTNAAWCLGMIGAPSSLLAPLLGDRDPLVQQEALSSLTKTRGKVPVARIISLLHAPEPATRGAAALALSTQSPMEASRLVPAQLNAEVRATTAIYQDWRRRGQPPLTDAEKATIVKYYRCQMQEVLAISHLHGVAATRALAGQAFRPGRDFSAMNGVLATFELWDRVPEAPEQVVEALGRTDATVADHAETILLHSSYLPISDLTQLLNHASPDVRQRVLTVLAFSSDARAARLVRSYAAHHSDSAWAEQKLKQSAFLSVGLSAKQDPSGHGQNTQK